MFLPVSFTWSSRKIESEPLEISDTQILILDKDDQTHVCTIEGDWNWWGYEPYVIDSLSRAEDYLEGREYLETDEGLKIPRCNIKNVKFKEVNQREVTPTYTLPGVKNWSGIDWFCVMCTVAFGAITVGCIGAVVWLGLKFLFKF